MPQVSIPYYYKSIDWNNFVKEYPPPAEFAETVYTWDRNRINELQEERFKKAVQLAWTNPFYMRKWTEAGLEPKDVQSLKDIERLPVVSSNDFKDEIAALPPFGAHNGDPIQIAQEIPLKINSTGGTTGMPRPVFFGPVEWELNGITAARGLFMQGARPGDRLQICFTPSLANAGWCYYLACHHWLGALAITTGSGNVNPTKRQLEIARAWGTNMWYAMPEYLLHLAKVAREELGFDIRDLKTKLILGFLGPDLSGRLRRELEDLFGCNVYDNYGNVEIALGSFECKEKAGAHFHEDLYYIEVCDTDTDEPVPKGEAGDLVVTSFYRQHPPLIRYSTKDRIRLMDNGARCACGSYLVRMDRFLGRSDDMVKLRGQNTYPMACLDTVTGDARSTGQWICVVERIGEGIDAKEEMTVKIEYKDENIDEEDFKQKMEKGLKIDLGVRVTVEPVPAGSLAPLTGFGSEKKARRLLDKRPALR